MKSYSKSPFTSEQPKGMNNRPTVEESGCSFLLVVCKAENAFGNRNDHPKNELHLYSADTEILSWQLLAQHINTAVGSAMACVRPSKQHNMGLSV